LIIREKALNDDVKRRHWLIGASLVVVLADSGYGLCGWQDSAKTAAFSRCLNHPLQASGHFYCDVTSFFGSIGEAGAHAGQY
jgi:hypothetical protein